MNEVEFIERQLHLERAHLREAAAPLRARPAPDTPNTLTPSRLEYLHFALERFESRAASESLLLTARLEHSPAAAHTRLRETLAALGEARQAGQRVRTLIDAGFAPGDIVKIVSITESYDRFFESEERLHALTRASRAAYSIVERRQIAHLDADAVLEERRRFGAIDAQAHRGG